MAYHHLALAVGDIKATHAFYEGVMGFELVKVEVASVPSGGWAKHFFYRMDGDDTKFIAFWELHDTKTQDKHVYNLNKAGNLPMGINHFSFNVDTIDELNDRRERWTDAGYQVLEIDHNWCRSIYINDPDGNFVEFCLTTAEFKASDRQRALDALSEKEMKPTPKPASMNVWPASGDTQAAE